MSRISNLLLGASTLVLLGSGAAWADVTIATAGPMTGQYAVFGEQMKRGAELAVKDINAKGGIKGRPIKFIVEDDALRNARLNLVAATRQVIQNGLKLLGVSAPEKMSKRSDET